MREANKYFFIESTIALGVSLVINIFVVAVFAHGMYQKTNQEIYEICEASGNPHADIFTVIRSTVDSGSMVEFHLVNGCKIR